MEIGKKSWAIGVLTGFFKGSIPIFLAFLLEKYIKIHGITNTSKAPKVPETTSMTSPVLLQVAVIATIGIRYTIV